MIGRATLQEHIFFHINVRFRAMFSLPDGTQLAQLCDLVQCFHCTIGACFFACEKHATWCNTKCCMIGAFLRDKNATFNRSYWNSNIFDDVNLANTEPI